MKINKNIIIPGISLTLIITIAFLLIILIAINTWFDTHKLVFKKPIEITFNKPITIEKRNLVTPVIQIVEQLPSIANLTPIEEYICQKWGAYDCKTALAIARAESKMDKTALNINTNSTIDIGIFQINSIHFNKEGCSLKDLVNEYKNVDCAFKIWKNQGWNPWVAFTNGNFKSHL